MESKFSSSYSAVLLSFVVTLVALGLAINLIPGEQINNEFLFILFIVLFPMLILLSSSAYYFAMYPSFETRTTLNRQNCLIHPQTNGAL